MKDQISALCAKDFILVCLISNADSSETKGAF